MPNVAKDIGTMIRPGAYFHLVDRFTKQVLQSAQQNGWLSELPRRAFGRVQSLRTTGVELHWLPRDFHTGVRRLAVGQYNAMFTHTLMSGKELGLVTDVCGIHVVKLAARFRVAPRSNALAEVLAKV